MISIKKRPDEPECLRVRRETVQLDGNTVSGADWNTMTGDCKQVLRERLFGDQHGLCAYCQSRLAGTFAPTTAEPELGMIVEHWEARAKAPHRTLDWDNLLGVCPGWVAVDREEHCDRARKNAELHTDPTRPGIGDIFRYHIDGTIHADSPHDLDIRTLNLKARRLNRNRRVVLDKLRKQLRQKPSLATVQRLLDVAQQVDAEGRCKEYCGVAIYYLQKKEGQWS